MPAYTQNTFAAMSACVTTIRLNMSNMPANCSVQESARSMRYSAARPPNILCWRGITQMAARNRLNGTGKRLKLKKSIR